MGVRKRKAAWELISIHGLPSTHTEAEQMGSHYYFSEPCKRGHLVPRRTKLRDCPKCTQMRHRGELLAITRLVTIFSMLVDLSKRQVGFRGTQDSILTIDTGDYDDCTNEFKDDTPSRCPFDD